MRRRVLLGTLIAAFTLSSGGCYWAQMFLYDMLGQGPVPGGKFTCITCVKYPISPAEVPAGEWQITGTLVAADGDKLPRFVFVQVVSKDPEEKVLDKQTIKVKVNKKTGALSATKELKEVAAPIGGYLCVYLKPKGAGINPGARLMSVNVQNNDMLEASNDPLSSLSELGPLAN
jgi:hypothetical protein